MPSISESDALVMYLVGRLCLRLWMFVRNISRCMSSVMRMAAFEMRDLPSGFMLGL